MAQADSVVVENGFGSVVRQSINDVAQAAITMNAADTPPPDTLPGMPWYTLTNPGLSIRDAANVAWLRYFSWRRPDPPGAQNNEAAGYPVGAYWGTDAGKHYLHNGSGIWLEVGTGSGGGGGSGGGIFLSLLGVMWLVDTDTQPVLGFDASGIMWLVEDGS